MQRNINKQNARIKDLKRSTKTRFSPARVISTPEWPEVPSLKTWLLYNLRSESLSSGKFYTLKYFCKCLKIKFVPQTDARYFLKRKNEFIHETVQNASPPFFPFTSKNIFILSYISLFSLPKILLIFKISRANYFDKQNVCHAFIVSKNNKGLNFFFLIIFCLT